MKTLILTFFIAASFISSAQDKPAKTPYKFLADSVAKRKLVFILLEEDEKKAAQIQKKNPENYKVYQSFFKVYNEAIKKHGKLLEPHCAGIEYMTLTEIMTLDKEARVNKAFIYPYAHNSQNMDGYDNVNGVGNIFDPGYDKAKKKEFGRITDFTLLFKDGKYHQKCNNAFHLGVFILTDPRFRDEEVAVPAEVYIPLTRHELSEADVYYSIRSIDQIFPRLKTSIEPYKTPVINSSFLKTKTLYLFKEQLEEGVSAEELKKLYKGKLEVVDKAEYDNKMLEKNDETLFLVITAGVVLRYHWFGQTIVDGKTFDTVATYSNSSISSKTKGDYVNKLCIESLNKHFE